MLKNFRDISLQKKLIVLYGLFVGIPMLILLCVFIPLSQSVILKREYENRLRLLSIMAESVEFKIDSIERDILSLYDHKEIFNVRNRSAISLRKDLYDYFTGQVYFNNFHFVAADGTPITFSRYSDIFNPNDVFSNIRPDWFEAMDKASGKVVWFPPVQSNRNSEIEYFVCGNIVKNIYGNHERVGYAFFVIDAKIISAIFDTLRFRENDAVSVFDKDLSPVWYNVDANLAIADNISGTEGYYTDKNPNQLNMFNVFKRSSYNDWLFVCSTPLRELNYYGTLFILFLGFSLMFLIICLLIEARVISNFFIKPVQRLVVSLDRMDERMILNCAIPYNHDEIGVLYRSVKNMSGRIQTLLSDIEAAHKNELTQELNALQAQINPHFIYNTLDSICWIARKKKVPVINSMLLDLSHILRYSISDGKRYATIQQEIQWASAYVSLQQKRSPGQFSMSLDIDKKIYPYYTFRLVLQPFIENSILHGFKHIKTGGRIKITGRLIDGDIHITISDNGSGIPKDRLDTLYSNVERGIGIYNVHRRIRLYFGEKYGVAFFSDKGTTVNITLPATTAFEDFE